MRKAILGIGLGLAACCALVGAEESSVLRVMDLKAKGAPPALNHRKPRDNSWFPAFVGTEGAIHDHFRTGPETVALLEFFIGGRVGVNRDAEIEVIDDRSVADRNVTAQRLILHNGTLWMKSGQLKRPLEIQTNGGIMGIKGTEFTLESKADVTTLNVLQGAVEVRDPSQKLLGLAEPGDSYVLAQGQAPKQTHVDPEELRRQCHFQFSDLDEVALETYDAQVKVAQAREDHTAIGQKLDRLNQLLQQAEQTGKVELAPPFKESILAEAGPAAKEDMSPSQTIAALDTLSWKSNPQADGYVVFVSGKDDFKNLLFSVRTRDSRAVYPTQARPLSPGIYYWRVIPVDASDKPVEKAAQSSFIVRPPR